MDEQSPPYPMVGLLFFITFSPRPELLVKMKAITLFYIAAEDQQLFSFTQITQPTKLGA
jgi:hypothetical protein